MKFLTTIVFMSLLFSCTTDRKTECELTDQELTEYARSMAISKETAIQHCLEMQKYADSVNAAEKRK
jgi:hypothetical protein